VCPGKEAKNSSAGKGTALKKLIAMHQLRAVGKDHFCAEEFEDTGLNRLFGGQLLAQTVHAASRTVPEQMVLHSLHGYFLNMGRLDAPVHFRVTRLRDGRRYIARQVQLQQREKVLAEMLLSFHEPEPDVFVHQCPMPEVAGPKGLPPDSELFYEEMLAYGINAEDAWPMEFRQEDPVLTPGKAAPPRSRAWFRAALETLDEKASPACHMELLAYASDNLVLVPALRPHGLSEWDISVRLMSLDHALWVHRPCRVDEWLLFEAESDWAGSGRAFGRGRIFGQDGTLVASVAQEGVFRAGR